MKRGFIQTSPNGNIARRTPYLARASSSFWTPTPHLFNPDVLVHYNFLKSLTCVPPLPWVCKILTVQEESRTPFLSQRRSFRAISDEVPTSMKKPSRTNTLIKSLLTTSNHSSLLLLVCPTRLACSISLATSNLFYPYLNGKQNISQGKVIAFLIFHLC